MIKCVHRQTSIILWSYHRSQFIFVFCRCGWCLLFLCVQCALQCECPSTAHSKNVLFGMHTTVLSTLNFVTFPVWTHYVLKTCHWFDSGHGHLLNLLPLLSSQIRCLHLYCLYQTKAKMLMKNICCRMLATDSMTAPETLLCKQPLTRSALDEGKTKDFPYSLQASTKESLLFTISCN